MLNKMFKGRQAVFAVVFSLTGACLASRAQVNSLPYGVYWLPTHVSSTSRPDDPDNWTDLWKDSHIVGVVGRQAWEQLEYQENTYDWTYFDHLAGRCSDTQKYFEIEIAAGMTEDSQYWPHWLSNDGITFARLHDDKGFQITIPRPWDLAYQSKWGALIKAVAERYDGNNYLRAVQMEGPGRAGELYFCSNLDPWATEDYNWLQNNGGAAAWESAAETIAGFYAQAFAHTPLLYSTGRPIPHKYDPENQAMGDVIKYLNNAYNTGGIWRFGTRDSGYYLNAKPARWGLYFQGYQETKPAGRKAGAEAQQLWQTPYSALWFEVYDSDCMITKNNSGFDTFNRETYNPNQTQ
jgi:hypothetical protein